MRLPTLGPRDRRALVFGAGAIGALIVGMCGVPPARAWSASSVASAREVVAEAKRGEQSLRAGQALRDSMRVRGARFVALAPMLLDGSSSATAGATLASLISGAAATADAKLGAVHVRLDTARRADARSIFARVSARADVIADIRGLSRFLLALERGPTLLAIRELSVTQPEPAASPDRPEMLRIELVVDGLALARDGSPP
jgi:hypothetical protein